MPYTRFYPFKRTMKAPQCSKVSGIVYLSGSTPQQNAIVEIFDETLQVFVGQKLTDVNGVYSFDTGFAIQDSNTYTVTARYDSGSQKYNSYSQPYVTPVSNG